MSTQTHKPTNPFMSFVDLKTEALVNFFDLAQSRWLKDC